MLLIWSEENFKKAPLWFWLGRQEFQEGACMVLIEGDKNFKRASAWFWLGRQEFQEGALHGFDWGR